MSLLSKQLLSTINKTTKLGNNISKKVSPHNLYLTTFKHHQQQNKYYSTYQQHSSNKYFNKYGIIGLLIGTPILINYLTEKTELKAEEQVKEEQAVGNPHSTVRPEEELNRYEIEEFNALRELLEGKDKNQFDITIYQYQVCPFCCKVRAFLDFHKIPYKMVEVNPLFKSEIKFSKDYKKVPIVVVEDKEGTMNTKDVVKWRKWVDDSFVHTLAPNIYRSNEEAKEAFEYISEQNGFGWWQKQAVLYGGSFTMYAVAKRLKKRYGIVDERQAIYDCGKKWANEAIGQTGPFHGGQKPDLADLSVYGILTSIEGLRTFNDLVKEVPQLGAWYDLMKRTVGPCSGTKINK